MNLQVNFGKTKENADLIVDLHQDATHNILITGFSGSGKSYLCHSLIQQLMKNNLPADLGFVMMDLKRIEYSEYENSPYLVEPIIYSPQEGLKALERYAELAKSRVQGKEKNQRSTVIIIEECDIVYENPELFAQFWVELNQSKERSGIYVLFSSSRTAQEVFSDTVVNHSDLRLFLITNDVPESYQHIFGKSTVWLKGHEME